MSLSICYFAFLKNIVLDLTRKTKLCVSNSSEDLHIERGLILFQYHIFVMQIRVLVPISAKMIFD